MCILIKCPCPSLPCCSTAYFAAENGGIGPGSNVVVVGTGPVGLLAILAAQQLGASKVA